MDCMTILERLGYMLVELGQAVLQIVQELQTVVPPTTGA